MRSFRTKLEDFINSSLDEESRNRNRQAIEAVLQSGASSYQRWLDLIVDRRASPDLRGTACWIIGMEGNARAFSFLARALQDENPHVRGHAAGALASLRPRVRRGRYSKVLGLLIHAFQSDIDLDVRWQAGIALREFHDHRALKALIAVLANPQEPAPVRDVAAEALAYIPDERAFSPLIEALKDPAEIVRISAAYALSSLADSCFYGEAGGSKIYMELQQRAFLPLIEALQDPAEKVRYWVVSALGGIRDRRAIPELKRVAETDKGTWYGDEVAEAARYAIQSIKEKRRD